MHSNFLERTRKISEHYFLNFYFLKVDISLSMQDLNLKLHICVQDIVMEGRVSQIVSKVDSSFFMRYGRLKNKCQNFPFLYTIFLYLYIF